MYNHESKVNVARPKRRQLGRAIVALVAAATITACGSSSSSTSNTSNTSNTSKTVSSVSGIAQTGPGLTEPTDPKGTRVTGGTVTFAEAPGSSPNYIFPGVSAEFCARSPT
jgi:hypothetical protein